jgi:hypothetical protein
MEQRRDGGATALRPTHDVLWDMTWSLSAAAAWLLSSSLGPNPVPLGRTVTSEKGVDQYLELSVRVAPIEERLAVGFGRFPLPGSVFAAAVGSAHNDVRDGARDNCGLLLLLLLLILYVSI